MTCKYDSIISIDLSTTATGYSFFDCETRDLCSHGIIKPKVKGLTKLVYPERPLLKMKDIAEKLINLINSQPCLPKVIVIEEIAGSKNRLGQKVLDAAHFLLLDRINDYEMINRVIYYDVTGANGWRKHLDLKLSDADKAYNKESKALNKTMALGHRKIPLVTAKTLACRYANKHYGLSLDEWIRVTDADIADSICMGHAYLHKVLK